MFRRARRGGVIGEAPLTGQAVPLIIKDTATRAGIDTKRLSAHSLRSGFVTAAAAAGASERQIARQTGHRSPVVLRS